MNYVSISETEFSLFHKLMDAYYREGEDAETSQEEIDEFIRYLYDLCRRNKIQGCVAWDAIPVGFALWNVDYPDGVFSQKPGFGTILEIGISDMFRGKHLGRELAEYALSQLPVTEYYVCAYGPAESFWKKCGFRDSGEVAENGLKIYVRSDTRI